MGWRDRRRRWREEHEDAGGEVRGYFLYQYREYSDDRLTDYFISEIAYEDQEALRGLLGYIAALRDQFQTISMVTAADERLELRLSNPRDGGALMGSISKMYGPRVLYGAMARVLDVERALRARSSYNGVTGRVQLSILDEQFSANQGPWVLAFDGGRVEVETKAPVSSLTHGGASMGIGTFTQLYLNYVTASEVREMGLVSADDEAVDLLDRAFAGPRPALLDHF